MVTVNLPASLAHIAGHSIVVRESVANVGQLIQALERLGKRTDIGQGSRHA